MDQPHNTSHVTSNTQSTLPATQVRQVRPIQNMNQVGGSSMDTMVLKNVGGKQVAVPASYQTHKMYKKINEPMESGDVENIQSPVGNNIINNTNASIVASSVSIMGVLLPKSTLYLLLILIVIAIVIWYFSRDSTKKNKNDENDE